MTRCRNCRSTEHLLDGDGVVICRPCLMLVGAAVHDPLTVPPDRLEALAELHHDVVTLVRDGDVLAWEWSA